MPFAFRNQPLKTIYSLYATVYFLVALPGWVVLSAIPATRQRRTWTMSRSLILRVFQFFSGVVFAIDLHAEAVPDPEKHALNADKLGFVWVDPIPADMVKGEVADAAAINRVQPARVSGYWYGEKGAGGAHGQRAGANEKVIYALHGGAYVFNTAAPGGMSSTIVDGYLQHLSGTVKRVFALEYRLAASSPHTPTNAFPACLFDAVAGYRYLLNLGLSPSNIIVAGDSSGGGIAIMFTRYLVAEGILPVPGGLVLLSPSVDWGYTHDSKSPNSSVQRNSATDFTWPIFQAGYTRASLVGQLPASAAVGPWISPASLQIDKPNGILSGFPRSIVIIGGAEHTVDCMITFRDRLISDIGEDKVTWVEYPDGVHDFLNFKWHEPERTQCYEAIRTWLKG